MVRSSEYRRFLRAAASRLVALGCLYILTASPACQEQVEPGRPSPAHAFYLQSNQDDCLKNCHTRRPYDPPPPSRCLTPACHGALAARIAARQGFHGQGEALARIESGACSGGCHQEHLVTGEIIPEPFTQLAPGDLSAVRSAHGAFARFPLEGGHAKPECTSCHTRQNSRNRPSLLFAAPPRCVTCHPAERSHWSTSQLDKSPTRSASRSACERCHEATRFATVRRPLQFDHGRDTEFELLGRHAVLSCQTPRCHGGAPPQFRVPLKQYVDCTPCHTNVHGGTYGVQRCSTCHSADSPFKTVLPFDHNRQTDFALTGNHRVTDCARCHHDQAQSPPDLDCAECHRQRSPHGRLFTPRFPRCAVCHTGDTWEAANFPHAARTRFALASSRAQAGHHAEELPDCKKCHFAFREGSFKSYTALISVSKAGRRETSGSRSNSPTVRCAGCHQHQEEHHGKAPELPCVKCHRPGAKQMILCAERSSERCLLEQAGIGHGEGKAFRLVGGHNLARFGKRCLSCHQDTAFAPVSAACSSCHAKDNPHGKSLGASCERCHAYEAGSWKRIPRLDHQRDFPLEGKHAEPKACTGCHPSTLGLEARFAGRPRTCSAAECHGKPGVARGDAHQGRNGPTCNAAGCHQPAHRTFRCLSLSADKTSCPP